MAITVLLTAVVVHLGHRVARRSMNARTFAAILAKLDEAADLATGRTSAGGDTLSPTTTDTEATP